MCRLSIFWGGVVVLLLAGCPVEIFGQAPATPTSLPVLDLPTLLAEVEVNNLALQASRLEADALGTRRRQETALHDPMVMVGYMPRPMLTAHGFQRSEWGIEQAIPFPGKRALMGDIADAEARMATLGTEDLMQELRLNLKVAYYTLFHTQEADRLVTAFQQDLRDFETSALTRYAVGEGTQQAILMAQLERNRLDLRREMLAEAQQSTLTLMARLLNREDLSSLQGTAQVAVLPVPSDTLQLLQVAWQRHPEAHRLREEIGRSHSQVALARRAFLPDFTVGMTYADIAPADAPPTADGEDALGLRLGIRVPLWRSPLRARLEETQTQRRKAEVQLDALKQTLRTQIADYVSQLRRQQQRLTLFEEILIPQAEAALETTLSAYTTGRADFLHVLDVERTLFDLRVDQLETLVAYLQTRAYLERTLGVRSLDEIKP